MPVDVVRLGGSRFNAMGDDSAWRCGVMLWFASWHQTPAGTLPTDDDELISLCGLGRGAGDLWQRVKSKALHGWVLCSDGRMHHPTIAEIALEAWLGKLGHRISSAKGNATRWGATSDIDLLLTDLRAGIEALETIAPKSSGLASARRILNKSLGDPPAIPPGAIGDGETIATGEETGPPATEIASQGEGEGKGRSGVTQVTPSPRARTPEEENRLFIALAEAYPSRGRSSPVANREAFDRIDPEMRPRLVACAQAYAAAQPWGTSGPPGLNRWLREGYWRDFLDAAPVAKSAWAGPGHLREAVVSETSEGFAVSYLDAAAWEAPTAGQRGRVLAASETAAERLSGLGALALFDVIAPQRRQA